jgi:beta-glucosidase
LQGNDSKYLKVSACAKHFAVHSGPEKTRHAFNALPNERDAREIYFPAFKALVDSGVESVMCAYNRLYDSPCCGSNYLLNDILRVEWGFKGHIVSDCWALTDFVSGHKVAKNEIDAAVMAANAGVNLNCGVVYKNLKMAVDSGLLDEKQIDKILKPLLITRFRLGMFDPMEMVPYAKIPVSVVNSSKHQELAYKAASKSLVLLQNKNSILPLDKNKLKKMLVTGPLAANNEALMGNYNGFSGNMVTVLEGIINKVDAGTVVEYSPGCMLSGENIFHGFWVAGSAEVVVAVMGLNHLMEGEDGDAMLNQNGGDRIDLQLPENQLEFLRQMRKTIGEKPLVVVVMGGSAIDLSEIQTIADAVLFAWYPGEQGGNAIADILFGDINPSGKLPVTFYKSASDLPPFDDYSMEGRTYKYFRGKPVYPFGFGLSYSNFEIGNFNIGNAEMKSTDHPDISCTIENTGNFDGEEVIQVYAKKIDPLIKQPIKTLIGFQRIFVTKGKAITIKIPVDLKQLYYWDVKKKKFCIEEGKYLLQIGTSSENIILTKEIVIRE